MKLSEAIRFGCSKSQPIIEQAIKWDGPGESVQACALGAAWLATHELHWNEQERSCCQQWNEQLQSYQLLDILGSIREDYPVLLRRDIVWPEEVRYLPLADLEGTIMALNDQARWDRERIAEWIESLGY